MNPISFGSETGYEVCICELGHHNPPDFPRCRVCGGELDLSTLVIQPKLGWIRSSDGKTVALENDLLVGRAPKSEQGQILKTLTTPANAVSISRRHLLIHVDGWIVTATDLGSNNGTVLRRANGDTIPMSANQPLNVQPGDVLELAEGYQLKFEA